MPSTSQKLNVCSKMVALSESLITTLGDLVELKARVDQSAMTFVDQPFLDALAVSDVKHLDAALIGNIIENVGVLNTYFTTNSYYNLYQKARS